MRRHLERLMQGERLEADEAAELLQVLVQPSMSPAMAGAVLAALATRGETATEIRGFAQAMRRLSRRLRLPEGLPAIDVVGTGGDGSGSLNLSTGAALLAAACGLPVVKHGNRSVSSRCGSADVLEALGLKLPLDEIEAQRCLEQTGFTFLYAPYFHPAMAALAPVRRALGVRTVFNLLGPLVNPAEPPYAVIGAYSAPAAALVAEALSGLAIQRAFVVHGEPGWDEATPVGPFLLFDVRPGKVDCGVREPASYGFRRARPQDLTGSNAAGNARRLRAALEGEPGAHRDALVLGAALALEVSGAVTSAAAARAAAEAAIDGGAAQRLLDRVAAFGRSTRRIEGHG